MNQNSKILIALLGGLAAGAVIGLLFAPDKGSETRKNLSATAKKFADKAKKKFAHNMNGKTEFATETNREEEI
jgi:gas vesicle protein